MNIFRKKLIEGLALRIKVEIEMMEADQNYSTPEDVEWEILFQAKELGYDYEQDQERQDNCIGATQPEIWKYWLTDIIPNFEERRNIK